MPEPNGRNNGSKNDSEVVRKRVKKFGKIGGAMAGGGALVTILFPMILNFILGWQLQVKEGNIFTTIWQDVPIPLMTKLYFFNIENPEEFRRGAKPKLREMGPYAYTTHMRHEIHSFGPNQESVKFSMILGWNMDMEQTVGSPDDKVTMVNIPAYAAAGITQNVLDKIPFSFTIAPIVFGFLNVFLYSHGEGLFTTTTVRDIVEGRVLGIVETVDMLVKPMKWLGIHLPEFDLLEIRMSGNKFGLFHLVNNTRLGPFEMWTGQTDSSKFGQILSFQGKRDLGIYNDPRCNMINGTEGLNFGSYIGKEDKLYLFIGACRSFYLTYKGLTQVKGVPAWRFILPPSMFASPDKNPDNKCFCTTPDDYEMCDGIFDIGPCQYLAPVAVSYPHLLYASEKIRNLVEGMEPDPDKHEAYFNMNSMLGSPIDANVRIQANLLIKSHSLLYGFGSLPVTVLPFLWVEVIINIEGILEWLLKFGVYSLYAFQEIPMLAFLGGSGVLGYTSYLAFKDRKVLFKPKPKPSNPTEVWNAMERQSIASVRQTEAKAKNMYPNLFNVSDNANQMRQNPPRYTDSQQQSAKRDQPSQAVRGSSPLNGNGINESQLRSLSPPGAVE